MKKYLLGGLAAVCCAVGLSSYTSQQFSGPYYFKVNTGVNKPVGTADTYSDGQVSRIAAIADASCSGTSNKDCVVTFLDQDLTANFNHLSAPAQQTGTHAVRASN